MAQLFVEGTIKGTSTILVKESRPFEQRRQPAAEVNWRKGKAAIVAEEGESILSGRSCSHQLLHPRLCLKLN